MEKGLMNRRNVVVLLGAFSLGGTALLWRRLASLWRPGSAERTARTMAGVCDVMFPGGDGLPGASALGLHDRVLATPDLQALITKGVAWLDKYAASQGAGHRRPVNSGKLLVACSRSMASCQRSL